MSCTWYWETRNAGADLALLREEICKLDRGLLHESEENKPLPWKLKCSVLLKKKGKEAKPSSTPAAPTPGEASRMLRVENPGSWPTEEVLVVPNTQQVQAKVQDGKVEPSRMAHTVIHTTRAVQTLPFYSEFAFRQGIVVEGYSYFIGDFQINLGVCRVAPTAFIVVQARHLPCDLPHDAAAYNSVGEAMGLAKFPNHRLSVSFEPYAHVFPETYGPMHQAVETVELFFTLMRQQRQGK